METAQFNLEPKLSKNMQYDAVSDIYVVKKRRKFW